MTDISAAIERLRLIRQTTHGYGVSVLDVYQCRPEGEFYADLRATLAELGRLRAERAERMTNWTPCNFNVAPGG